MDVLEAAVAAEKTAAKAAAATHARKPVSRHDQVQCSKALPDLFLTALIDAPVKDEQWTMVFPFFSIAKTPRRSPIEYSDGKMTVRIEPGSRGMATIWDKDILIYCASVINDRIGRGAPVERTLRIPAYDLLTVCRRGTGKAAYQRLYQALVRLRSTTILTNIAAAGRIEDRGFGWIDDFRSMRKPDGTMMALEITLSRWVFGALIEEGRLLSIDRAYFEMTGGLERRLYELARKHCGRQPQWTIRLPKLAAKCGTARDLRKFKLDLKRIISRQSLPGCDVNLAFDRSMRKSIEADFGRSAATRFTGNSRVMAVFTPKCG